MARLWIAAAILATLATSHDRATAETTVEQSASSTPIHQLRIYEIFENNKAAFHERFRTEAIRIMKKYDFNIVAMWESRTPQRTEFVYLLEWPDEATMQDRWAKFMADQEWKDIKKRTGAQHGALVGDIEERTLYLTSYSPRTKLTN